MVNGAVVRSPKATICVNGRQIIAATPQKMSEMSGQPPAIVRDMVNKEPGPDIW
jgi:hypothetical protein